MQLGKFSENGNSFLVVSGLKKWFGPSNKVSFREGRSVGNFSILVNFFTLVCYFSWSKTKRVLKVREKTTQGFFELGSIRFFTFFGQEKTVLVGLLEPHLFFQASSQVWEHDGGCSVFSVIENIVNITICCFVQSNGIIMYSWDCQKWFTISMVHSNQGRYNKFDNTGTLEIVHYICEFTVKGFIIHYNKV